MSGFIGDWQALFILVIAGFLPNEVWRLADSGSAAASTRVPKSWCG